MSEFELVLFDLDGTLLDPDRRVRPANAALIAELVAAGVRVGVATGRMPRSVRPFVDALGLNGPLLLLNGGMIWDVARAAPAHEERLPLADALAVLRIAAELGIHVNLYVDEELLIAERSATSVESERKDGVAQTAVGDLAVWLQARGVAPYKLLLIQEQGAFEELERRALAVLQTPCTLVHSEPTYLEILPPGVCKGAALSAIERHYGIAPERVMAFGDNLNDLELVERAGLGVAMGNAHPALVAAADLTIGPHDSDAIAELLRGRFVWEAGRIRPRP